MQLLLVEDEEKIGNPLKRFLESSGYVVTYHVDAESALKDFKVNSSNFDCLILDVNLPGMTGFELLSEVRKITSQIPVLMLTARTQIKDKLSGFEKGADDYLTKPFSILELKARVETLIRRNSQNKIDQLVFANYYFYPEQNLLKNKNDESEIIELSNKETGILEYLIRNDQKIVSAEELIDHVWDRNLDEFSDTVKTHIKTLRKKIGKNKDKIRTVRGKGYQVVS